MISLFKAVRFVPLLLTLSVTFSYANHYYLDTVINHPRFTNQIETIASEVKQKTPWSIYVVTVDEINSTIENSRERLFAYEKELSQGFNTPYVLFILAIKEQKVDITGSEGFENVISKQQILEDDVYPILGSKIKQNEKEKYLAVTLNGVAEIAEQIAAHHNVVLENAVGNANKDTLNVVRVLFYATILFFVAIYIYRRFIKRRI